MFECSIEKDLQQSNGCKRLAYGAKINLENAVRRRF
jgi:hypothetical protein